MRTDNIYFLSFGGPSLDYIDAVNRICNQANRFYLFKKIYKFTDEDLKNDINFWSKHKDFILSNSRGYGYWLWKPYLIKKILEKISYGDILLYCDSGCEINFNARDYMNELIYRTQYKLIIGTCGSSNDINFTKMDTIKYFKMENHDKLSDDHMQCTALMMIKCDKIINLINEWYETGSNNYHLIDDTPSIYSNNESFLDHRHDQSIFNMIVKRDNLLNYDLEPTDWGCEYAARDNYLKNGINYPIWTCRNRYGKAILDLNLNNSLSELAKKYNTDKYDHGFINLYYDKLNQFKNNNFNLLEIGVQWGASINMWYDYFNNANIYAADNYLGINGNKLPFDNPRKFIDEVKEKIDRIKIIYLDQSKENELNNFANKCNNDKIKFKIIIDDGSHLMKDQQISLFYLFDLIEPKGLYIIENLHTYKHIDYDVLPDGSNSTKLMLENMKNRKILKSYYLDDTNKCEIIVNNIDKIDFYYFSDESEVAIIYKV